MSRADYERRKRSAQCPECGKKFSAQGLNGHLRFVHGQGAATVTKTKEKAQRVGAIASRTAQTIQLTQQLKQLREQRRDLKEMDEGGLWDGPDKAVTAAKAAIDRSEHELVNELRKLAGQAPLTDEGEEPEESDDDDSEDEDDD